MVPAKSQKLRGKHRYQKWHHFYPNTSVLDAVVEPVCAQYRPPAISL